MKAIGLAIVLVSITTLSAAKLAIIDSGVDYKHKALASTMWTNPQSKTVDADGKAYEQDTHGWNFAENNNQIIDYQYLNTFSADCKTMFAVQGKILNGTATDQDKKWYQDKKNDKEFLKELGTFANFVHGTHVSGIASHKAEQSQVIGAKLIPTKSRALSRLVDPRSYFGILSLNRTPNPLVQFLLSALAKRQAQLLTTIGKYTHATGARVANGSFGTSVTAITPLMKQIVKSITGEEVSDADAKAYAIYFIGEFAKACADFVKSAPNTLFVFAAGNDGTDNDSLPTSPANVKAPNSIAVAATLGTSSLATFSNYGSSMVEVAAPGVVIRSTIPGDEYLEMSGTSMAAPFVANVAEVVTTANPKLTPAEVKKILMETVDKKSFLAGKVASGGIVNRSRAEHAADLSLKLSLNSAIEQANKEVGEEIDSLSSIGFNEADLLVFPLPSSIN